MLFHPLPSYSTILATVFLLSCAGEPDAKAATSNAKTSANKSKKPLANTVATAQAAKTSPPSVMPVDPAKTIYNFDNNRLLAHWQTQGGLLVKAGNHGFIKYLRFSRQKYKWKIADKREGASVSIAQSGHARLRLPLTKKQAGTVTQLRARIYSKVDRRVTLRLNNKNSQETNIALTAGWNEVKTQLTSSWMLPGENELEMFARGGAGMELDWLYVGPSQDEALPMPNYDETTSSFVVEKNTGFAFYVFVPKKGVLAADISGPCKVTVRAESDKGLTATTTLDKNTPSAPFQGIAGEPVRLDFSVTNPSCGKAAIANLRFVGSSPAPLPKASPPRNVVLWIMDSLRADRVPTFVKGARATTPFMDELATTGTVFEHAYVQGNESRASHASIWSSLYPVVHKMITSKAKLAGKWTTIDEVTRAAGLWNAGVSANGYVAKKWGFGAAWDVFANHIHQRKGLSGKTILKKGLSFITSTPEEQKPWFLYLGTIDTHVSWRAKKPWIDQYAPKGYKGKFRTTFSGIDAGRAASGKLKVSKQDIEHIRAIYDSNVSYQDELLGQLIKHLKETGQYDNTMIIITADHGDEQWERGRIGHGGSLRETLVHVPLLIHYPPLFPSSRVHQGVEVVDIVPTVADALGVKPSKHWQGTSLIPLANGIGTNYPQMAIASQFEGKHAARVGDIKFVASGGRKPSLYDFRKDQTETKNIATSHPITKRVVSDPFWLFRGLNPQWKKSRWGNPANVTKELMQDLSK